MNIEGINKYCEDLSTQESEILAELRRETYLKTLRPHMISGPLQGQLLRFLVQLFKSERVLEIGTFTGYASICLAAGLGPSGKVYTLEMEEEYQYFHDKYFEKSGLQDKIIAYYGDANDVINDLEIEFDFVFMDAGKKDYKAQFNTLLSKMRKGGVILADNVLWKGKIIEEKKDKMTQQIHDFNTLVQSDPRVENLIMPIRDGINLIVVK